MNTVLWNTIQLLFPEEVEARRAAGGPNSQEAKQQSPEKESQTITRNRRVSRVSSRGDDSVRRRRGMPSQDEDAALALRLQREEFMGAIREEPHQQEQRTTVSLARANLRAMASRAVSLRVRGRPYLL